LMRDGSAPHAGKAFDDRLEKIGAKLDAAVEAEYGALRIQALSRFAPEMIALLADAALRPALRDADLKWRRDHLAAALVGRRGSSYAAAYEVLPELVFGIAHPYGHAALGTPKSLAAIDINAVREQHQHLLRPEQSVLVVIGDVKREQIL